MSPPHTEPDEGNETANSYGCPQISQMGPSPWNFASDDLDNKIEKSRLSNPQTTQLSEIISVSVGEKKNSIQKSEQEELKVIR